MDAKLKSALDGCYVVFAPYEDFYGFAKHSGVSRSLRELTREDWAAMDAEFDMGVQIYSDQTPNLLRHFLPRFLEWLAEDNGAILESWDLAYRLNHFRWLSWPTEEAEALRAVFMAWTRELLTDAEAYLPIEFLTEIKEDLTPHLNIWLQARPYELAQWLWTLDWKQHQDSWNWATKPHVEAALEAEFFRHPDGERAQVLSRSIELIRSLRG